MIDKLTITRTPDSRYDVGLYDGRRQVGGETGLTRAQALTYLTAELSMSQDAAATEVYSADQLTGQPREFWV